MTAIVATEGLTKAYGDAHARVDALRGVSLEVHPGELVALVGPSGSGKTALLNIVAGWEIADSGQVRWSEVPGRWSDLAVVPQQPGLLEELPAFENVTLPLRLGTVAVDDPRSLLLDLGIDHLADRLPHELSHGEQQRVSIARALVGRPRLLVADEPTAHLDEGSTGVVLDLLRSITGWGTACLIASHDQRVVEQADRLVELRDGLVL